MKKKLVILTTHFGTNFSGGSTATCEIFSRIEHEFEQVIVIGTKIGEHTFQSLEFIPYHSWFHAVQILKTFRNGSVVFYGDFYNSFLFILAKVHFSFTYHDNWPELGKLSTSYRIKSIFYVPIYQWVFQKAQRIFVVSKKKLDPVGKHNPNVSLIRNGFNKSLDENNKREKSILMVGNIDKRKYSKALELFSLLDNDHLQIDIYGHISDQEIHKQLIKFPFVRIIGFQTSIPYASYQLLLHTSIMENMSIVFCEALYSGTPVIAFDIGGASEIINDQNGILIPKYDLLAMKKGLLKSLNRTSPFRVDKGILNEFSWDKASKSYLDKLNTLEETIPVQ